MATNIIDKDVAAQVALELTRLTLEKRGVEHKDQKVLDIYATAFATVIAG